MQDFNNEETAKIVGGMVGGNLVYCLYNSFVNLKLYHRTMFTYYVLKSGDQEGPFKSRVIWIKSVLKDSNSLLKQ